MGATSDAPLMSSQRKLSTIRSFKQKENAPALRPGLNSQRVGVGGWGAGPDPPQCVCFCITKCQINASPLCAVPIHSRFFWSAVPAWARFREMTQAERSGGVNELPHPPNLGDPCDDDL